MTGTIRASANDILNQVGVEIGLDPVTDPFSSSDQTYRQMTYLINTAGEELSQAYPWEFLTKEHTIVTTGADSGTYNLPDDFLYLINQTGWNRSDTRPLTGPLSPQAWQYLQSYASNGALVEIAFRVSGDKLQLFPQPPEPGQTVVFEYISRNWVLDASTGNTYRHNIIVGADQPLFNRTLLGRYLKVKILEARGFDTTKAQADLNQSFQLLTARDKGAPVLNASRSRSGAYIGSHSIPDTGYGNP